MKKNRFIRLRMRKAKAGNNETNKIYSQKHLKIDENESGIGSNNSKPSKRTRETKTTASQYKNLKHVAIYTID